MKDRIEKKYFIRKDEKDAFLDLCKKHLGLKGNAYDKEYTHVRSFYYDSGDLICYRDHFDLANRFKIRIRNYSPDGYHTDFSFIEFKKKVGMLTEKRRFKYPRITRKNIPSEFDVSLAKTMNPDLPDVVDLVNLVNQLIRRFDLHPLSRIAYDRISMENEMIRVTLDSHIDTRLIAVPKPEVSTDIKNNDFWVYTDLLTKYFDSAPSFLIAEIKDPFENELHLPLPIQKFLLDRRENFSKYCYSITKYIRERKAYEFRPQLVI